jgi:hypothetical protein
VNSPSCRPIYLLATVDQSTVEAEYAAMAHAAKEAIWLQYLLKDPGMSKYKPKVVGKVRGKVLVEEVRRSRLYN